MRARRPSLLCALGGAVTAVTVVTAAPAVATDTTAPVVTGSAAANVAAAVAGYVASVPAATRRVATGSFTIPRVSCSRATQSPLFMSIGLFGVAATAGGGFDFATGGLTVTCTAGRAYYQAEVSTNPGRAVLTVRADDTVSVLLVATRGRTTATLTNSTTGASVQSAGNGMTVDSLQATAQGGFDGQSYPRPATLRFSGIKLDGATLGSFAPTVSDQVRGGVVLLQASPLAATGVSFTVRYRSQP